jgi:hypothetical protein
MQRYFHYDAVVAQNRGTTDLFPMFGMTAFLTPIPSRIRPLPLTLPIMPAGVTHGADGRAQAADVARYNVKQ